MNGSKVIVQYGIEDTYGTVGTAIKQIEIASETFKLNLNKKEEGLLTGQAVGGRVRTVSKSNEGGFKTIARPDDVGLFLAAALGDEATVTVVPSSTAAYKHDFTITDEDVLPSLFFKVKRDSTVVKSYSGLAVESVNFDSTAEDYLNIDVALVGKDEEDDDLETGLSVSPLAPFRFAGATLTVGGSPLEVVSTKFSYVNNHDAKTQTNLSGLYFKQPEVGQRDITAEVEAIYDAESNGVRDNYWLTDNDVAISIMFVSGQDVETGYPYSLTFTLPLCQVTEATVNISGKDRVKLPLKLKLVDDTGFKVTLINGLATKYFA